MTWPVKPGWEQHLKELNIKEFSRPMKVSLIKIESPFSTPQQHVRHVHPYWHIQIIFARSFRVDFDSFSLTPDAGSMLVIPPQNWHYYDFSCNGSQAWNLKFAVEGMEEQYPPGLVERTPETEKLAAWILEVVAREENCSPARMVLVEHLIEAVLDLHFFRRDVQSAEAEIISKVRRLIDIALQENGFVRVNELARKMGCSPALLNRKFKRRLGIPLKSFIDQARFECAKKLVVYSTLSVGEIAEETGFADTFAFSRFFRRMSGKPPTVFRDDFIRRQLGANPHNSGTTVSAENKAG